MRLAGLASDANDRAEMNSIREHLAELSPSESRTDCDQLGRILPGLVPGWGMSWWWYEQGLDPSDLRLLRVTPQRVAEAGRRVAEPLRG